MWLATSCTHMSQLSRLVSAYQCGVWYPPAQYICATLSVSNCTCICTVSSGKYRGIQYSEFLWIIDYPWKLNPQNKHNCAVYNGYDHETAKIGPHEKFPAELMASYSWSWVPVRWWSLWPSSRTPQSLRSPCSLLTAATLEAYHSCRGMSDVIDKVHVYVCTYNAASIHIMHN